MISVAIVWQRERERESKMETRNLPIELLELSAVA
jgi:hypothetical protein